MIDVTSGQGPLRSAASRFRACWKPLAVTDIGWKLLAFVVLTPLVTVLFRILLLLSGREVVADQDLVLLFLHPAAFVAGVVLAAMLLAIVALEQAALMAILYAHEGKRPVAPVVALRFALAHAWPVLRITSRMVGGTVLVAAPFLAALGLVYLGLLHDHDINFYLRDRPPAFWAAAGLGGVIVLSLTTTLLHLFTGWFFALPLVLFEDVSPRHALAESRRRAQGHRLALCGWIAGWAASVAAATALLSWLVVGLARIFVPRALSSFTLLSLAIGATLVGWAFLHLGLNLLGTTTGGVGLFTLYRSRGGGAEPDGARVGRFERAWPSARFSLTAARVTRWGIAAVALACVVGVVAVQSASLDDNVQVIAHRGSSKAAPENSLSAVRQAIAEGADWVEIDVQETADGEVIVTHDSDFMRLAGVGTKVWDATLADVQAIDIGSRFSPAFKGEHPPTLADVLDACKGRIKILIELKYYGHDAALEEKVARLVEARGMASQVAIMSLELDMVRKMKTLRPAWKVGFLMSVSEGRLRGAGADFLAVNGAFATRRFTKQAHRQGMGIYVWTVDDTSTISAMIGRGVDGVITNRPAVARSVLKQRAGMSPAVRIALELADFLGVKRQLGEV